MKFARPRSLTGLLLLGFALVALPLIIAIVRAAFAMDRLANESEQLVVVGVEATRLSQSLLDQLRDLERGARLYQVLGNPDLKELYAGNHRAFLATLGQLAELSPDETVRDTLGNMRQMAEGTMVAVGSLTPGSPELETALERFEPLKSSAAEVAGRSRSYISLQLTSLREDTRKTRETLAWQTAALVPGTLGLIGLFVFLVAKPIRQIDRVISDLGRGAFSRPIKVAGPSDLQSLGRQLEWLRNRLLELAQERNRFLRHMSHELKTPLANIREGTELLMDGSVGELSEGQQEVATILRSSGMRLQQDIENLLSFSAWQSKTASLELSEFDLKSLVYGVLRNQQLTLASRNVRVKHKVEDLRLRADREKIRMVLDNLLSNATKFTPVNGVIYLRARREDAQLILELADSGPGIPPDERSRVFDAFYQGSTPQQGHVKGTGIGLSVVMECVHAHGGIVEIVDGEFSGAHFRIHLPLEQVETHA